MDIIGLTCVCRFCGNDLKYKSFRNKHLIFKCNHSDFLYHCIISIKSKNITSEQIEFKYDKRKKNKITDEFEDTTLYIDFEFNKMYMIDYKTYKHMFNEKLYEKFAELKTCEEIKNYIRNIILLR